MTSMKSGSWLLAAGLVLGWAGSAAADRIILSVDKPTIREEGGRAEITVTATNVISRINWTETEVDANTVVSLSVGAGFPPSFSAYHRLDVNGAVRMPSSWQYYDQPPENVALQPTGPPTNPPPGPNRKSRPGGDWKGWYDSQAHINSRFAITLPTLVIPKKRS